MAPKKKDTLENLKPEEAVRIDSEKTPVAAEVDTENMADFQDTFDEAIEIPDIPMDDTIPDTVRPTTQHAPAFASKQMMSVTESVNGSSAIGVARAAINAERTEIWDVEQEDRTTVGIFLTAMKENRILEGTIAGLESNRKTAYWVLYEGPVTVRIPFDNSFMKIPAELVTKRPTEDILRRQRQMLDQAMGAKINFTISKFEPDGEGSYIATGSRTDALSKIRKRYFGPNAQQLLAVNDNIMAQVLTHGEHAAYLNFCGIDVKVKKSELSYKFIRDVSSTFHVGEMIRVRILSITPSETPGGIPTVSVSAKPIEKERFKRNLKRIHKNGSYIGTVISMNKKDGPDGEGVTVSLFLENVGVPAFSRSPILELGEVLHQGDQVAFLALGVNDDGYAHGKILEIIKPRI